MAKQTKVDLDVHLQALETLSNVVAKYSTIVEGTLMVFKAHNSEEAHNALEAAKEKFIQALNTASHKFPIYAVVDVESHIDKAVKCVSVIKSTCEAVREGHENWVVVEWQAIL